MNPTPARQLKRFAESCRSRPPTTQRDRDRYVYILEAAQDMLIDTGRNRFTLPEFALCVGLSQLTIRRQISDLHHLFALVLSKHLDAILAAVGAIPFDSPDLFARRRLAYGRATRGICGIPTPLHFLLVRDRFTLPDDELESIDKQRRVIAFLVGRENGEDIMNLLDSPTLDLEKIEAMIAAMERMDESRRAGARPKPLLDCIVYDEPEPEPPPPPRARIQPAKPFPMTGLSPELANMSDAELTAYENGRIPHPPPEHKHEHEHEARARARNRGRRGRRSGNRKRRRLRRHGRSRGRRRSAGEDEAILPGPLGFALPVGAPNPGACAAQGAAVRGPASDPDACRHPLRLRISRFRPIRTAPPVRHGPPVRPETAILQTSMTLARRVNPADGIPTRAASTGRNPAPAGQSRFKRPRRAAALPRRGGCYRKNPNEHAGLAARACRSTVPSVPAAPGTSYLRKDAQSRRQPGSSS